MALISLSNTYKVSQLLYAVDVHMDDALLPYCITASHAEQVFGICLEFEVKLPRGKQ
jgi:hypothetical protein